MLYGDYNVENVWNLRQRDTLRKQCITFEEPYKPNLVSESHQSAHNWEWNCAPHKSMCSLSQIRKSGEVHL